MSEANQDAVHICIIVILLGMLIGIPWHVILAGCVVGVIIAHWLYT